jgi:iron complex outermembrane receptor protein
MKTNFAFLYRAPYWFQIKLIITNDAGTTYNGFQPTFNTDVFDNLDLLG